MKIKELSKCHKAPVKVSVDKEEGTGFYVCTKCRKACDLDAPQKSKKPTPKKLYTVSTYVFTSLAEAEAQLKKWDADGDLYHGTKVFECTGKVYEPTLKLVETKYDTHPKKK